MCECVKADKACQYSRNKKDERQRSIRHLFVVQLHVWFSEKTLLTFRLNG